MLWRLSGRCRVYLQNRMWASSIGPARPRAIGCDGAGVCAMVSQSRQENFSRTCWMTFHDAGTCSSISVTSSPILNYMSWGFLVAPVGIGAMLLALFAFTWHKLVAR